MTRTAVYRCFDAEGALLYVGRSTRPRDRVYEHKTRAAWAKHIARVESEWFDTTGAAKSAESQAICAEHPAHNEKSGASDGQIARLIDAWPARGDLAREIGASLAQVHKWAQSGRIPSDWQWAVVCAAQNAGRAEITAKWMLRAHDRERGAA